MNRRMIAGLAAVLVVAGCGEKKAEDDAMPGMGNMPGMPGMTMQADSLMPMMRAHLDSLAVLEPASAAAMLSAHDAMASRMLDAMGADMMSMGMKPDPTWAALTDSVRRDLAELPSLSGSALSARVRAHVERMRRLITMHDGMMRGDPVTTAPADSG